LQYNEPVLLVSQHKAFSLVAFGRAAFLRHISCSTMV
jgi:hypothetical protein